MPNGVGIAFRHGSPVGVASCRIPYPSLGGFVPTPYPIYLPAISMKSPHFYTPRGSKAGGAYRSLILRNRNIYLLRSFGLLCGAGGRMGVGLRRKGCFRIFSNELYGIGDWGFASLPFTA
jgi:hypothetical protein